MTTRPAKPAKRARATKKAKKRSTPEAPELSSEDTADVVDPLDPTTTKVPENPRDGDGEPQETSPQDSLPSSRTPGSDTTQMSPVSHIGGEVIPRVEIVEAAVDSLLPADYNPRTISGSALEGLRASVREFGLVQPIIVNRRTGRVVGGHQRLKVLHLEGIETTSVVVVDMDEDREKALNVALNSGMISGEFTVEVLSLIDEISTALPDLSEALRLPDLDEALAPRFATGPNAEESVPMKDKFGVPPFSVLDTRQGYWTDRRKAWESWGVRPEEGREDTAIGSAGYINRAVGRHPVTRKIVYAPTLSKASRFDPVLAEIVYAWFCLPGGYVLDPFAGDSTKGLVASRMGFPYVGVELREEQVQSNRDQYEDIEQRRSDEPPIVSPVWIEGDSANLAEIVPASEEFDLVFTSPPYYDLEVYSDAEEDGSTKQTYGEFMDWYAEVFRQAVERLKPQGFLVVKVSEIRDPEGRYRTFVPDNVSLFLDLGLAYLNEIILINQTPALFMRAGRAMKGRKVGRMHQNVLVFYKGDPREIADVYPQIDLTQAPGAEGDEG